MFYTDEMAVRSTGQAVKIRVGTEETQLTYQQVMALGQSLERWLQQSADENVGVWAFETGRRTDERAA